MRRTLIALVLLCVASQANAVTYMSRQTGNATDPNSWLQIDAASELDSEAANTALTTSYQYSSNFTFTSPTTTCGAVSVKIKSRTASPTGTITVQLYNNTTATSAFSVVLDVSDLNAANATDAGWYTFKTASPITPGTDSFKIGAKTSSASMVTLYSSATTNWSRMLRLTAAATVAPTTNDKLMTSGGCTAAATCTTHTITWDNVATASFGPVVSGGPPQGLTVNNYSTLTFGTAASTNYYLKHKGQFRVYGGATLNVGTSGAQIPSSSTAVVEADSAVNVDSGLYIDNGATMNVWGATKTNVWQLLTSDVGGFVNTVGTAVTAITSQCQSFTGMTGTVSINGVTYTISSVTDATHLVLTGTAGTQSKVKFTHTASPGTAKVIRVADTSGWAIGDTLAIAPTSQTYTESESFTIASVDSGTQVTLSSPLIYTHQGMPPATGPIAAEVLNLTRNVQIRGVDATHQGYIYVAPTATVTWRYADMNQLGSATVGKRGIDVATTTGSFDRQYCVRRDSPVAASVGLYANSTINNNITDQHNVSYNIANSHILTTATSGTSTTYNDEVAAKNSDSLTLVASFGDVGGTITNIRMAGGTRGIGITEPRAMIGTISNITSHSHGQHAINGFSGNGTATNVTIYRSTPLNLFLGPININTLVAIGGTFFNLAILENLVITNGLFACDSAMVCTYIFNNSSGTSHDVVIENSTIGVPSAIYTDATTSAFNANTSNLQVKLRNTTVNHATVWNDVAGSYFVNYIRSQRHNNTDGDHRAWYPYGTVNSSTVTLGTGHTQPYELMTPTGTTSTQKVESSEKCVPLAAGATATFTSYIYPSAAHTTSPPRMVLKAKDIQVAASDTVLATTVGNAGAWETVTGTTPASLHAGIACAVIDADNVAGTGGTIAVTDWGTQ